MAYTPNEWQCGDIVTAEKLNHIEKGVAEVSANSGAFVITATGTMPNLTGDKTPTELFEAIDQGRVCLIEWDASQGARQSVLRYYLIQYGTNPKMAWFSQASATGQNYSVETLKMSADGTITKQ